MNKEPYYTPDNDEFHKGFEFELLAKASNVSGTVMDPPKEWITVEYGNPFIHMLDYKKDDLTKFVRVRQLDRIDIEEFGFTDFKRSICDWYKFEHTVECPISHYTYQALRLQHDRDSRGIVIKAYEYKHLMEQDKEDVNLFRGIIRNKSEFKKLLKQINIIK